MEIKVLGTGCQKCLNLEKAVRSAAEAVDASIIVSKVTLIDEIMDYGVMMTPALVINEKVVSSGKALSKEQIIKLINENK